MSEENHEEQLEKEENQEDLEMSHEEPTEPSKQEPEDQREQSSTLRRVILILISIIAGVTLALVLSLLGRYGFLKGLVGSDAPPVIYFAEDQIILTGNITDVTKVAQSVADRLGIQLIRIDNIDEDKIPEFLLQPTPTSQNEEAESSVNGETEAVDEDSSLQSFAIEETAQATDHANTNIFLYRVIFPTPEERTTSTIDNVEDVVQEIRQESLERTISVGSGLNFAIGSPLVEVEGDPNCGEGTAITESLAITAEDAKRIFYNQWALNIANDVFDSADTTAQGVTNASSIGLFDSESSNGEEPKRAIDDSIIGGNVIVAMFDTSPFDLRGERVLDTTIIEPVDFGNNLVNHFETVGDPDVRDHGVFGASLVDIIAPESEIRFYRVLDQSNRGDLYTLLRALETLFQTWEAENTPPLVINMSLGIHPPPDSQAEADLAILENILRSFYDRGAVIVAAAGNDSAERSRMGMEPAPMQYPAAYDFVIGVGASNARNEMACFSNHADILAPGGDNDANCMLAVNECASGGIGSTSCVVGYVYTPPNAHYAYWNGTSFAAPLVSGVAALLMGDGLNRTNKEVYAILAPKPVSGSAPETLPVLDLANAVNQAKDLPAPTPQP